MSPRALRPASIALALSIIVASCSGADPASPADPLFAKAAATSVPVRINEIESSGGSPGDWIEISNPTSGTADISGWQVRDNDNNNRYTLPSRTRVNAGAYFVINESSLGFGLGAADAVRLFDKTGALIDSYSWNTHATTTYGRCANGSGAFTTTSAPTKAAANACAPTGPQTLPWPTSTAIVTADAASAFGSNMSGLAYEPSASSTGTLWASRNGPGTLYRLTFNGSVWTPDASSGWGAGRTLRYPNGSGNPDAEGVTLAASASEGIYVATERNNDVSATSRNSILRYDPGAVGTTLVATNEWNLTADLPALGSNTGLEAITWVPDSYLTANGFFDSARSLPYDPAAYPNHGSGLFFVGVEANGTIYAYALNHVTSGFTRVATITSALTGVMGLEFDRELNTLWAVCDDGCSGRTAILSIDTAAGSPTAGRFIVTRFYNRPTSMSNLNNEGFAIAPQSECANGTKPAFWSDDAATSGHALRRGTAPCSF